MEELEKVTGRIFDIQRYSIHDGPGIRTIVFLKGCFLRCRWCCNPESQEYKIQKMMVKGKEKWIGEDVTVGQVMEEIKKDNAYYMRSGGGVTLSGGEVLFQPEFAESLLRVCKLYGYHTAIESTGYAEYSVIEKILPHLDLYLLDIKHMNSQKHKQFTGRENEMILSNAKRIAKEGKELVIRVPVIPGFNDTKEEIREIAKFASSLENVKQLHLLPYHRLGQDKYEGLFREYSLKEIVPIEEQKMKELLEVAAEQSGLKCQIGG